MNEELLYYIWQHRLYTNNALVSEEGESIEVVNPGQRNHDAGPDFTNARIRIGDTLWAGNVEIHQKSSDWLHHKHQYDPSFGNIILHVVYEHDKDGVTGAPTLQLKGLIQETLLNRYHYLLNNSQWIPCEKMLPDVDEMTFTLCQERMVIERLEQKTHAIEALLKRNVGSWEETMYQLTARGFGLKVNREPFELMACSLPLNIIAKQKQDLKCIEALLFGQAGMLNDEPKDEYMASLQREYRYQQHKHQLRPTQGHSWKFMRLRPPSFPTVRLAQFAMLLHRSVHLFSKVLETNGLNEVEELFKVGTSEYWDTHYTFGKESAHRVKELGTETLHLLVINTIAPILFTYARHKGDENLQDRALQWLEQIKAEQNEIVKNWASLGRKANSAYQSQALIQLKNEHCDHKKCLSCSIGNSLLRKPSVGIIESNV